MKGRTAGSGIMVLARFSKQLGGGRLPAPSRQEAMSILAELLETGTLTPVIDSTYPLAEVREAFRRLIENEPRGRVMLQVAR